LAEDLEMRGWMRGGRMSSKRSPEDVDAGDVELEAWRRASRRGLTDDAERRAVRTIRGVVDDIVTDYYDAQVNQECSTAFRLSEVVQDRYFLDPSLCCSSVQGLSLADIEIYSLDPDI
jgi:hypothetical protein